MGLYVAVYGMTKSVKDLDYEEVTLFIDILEERPCLWDVFNKEYAKRDVRKIAYNELAKAFSTTIASVKVKINRLRAQLGREMSIVAKKS